MNPGVRCARVLPTALLAGLLLSSSVGATPPDATPSSDHPITPDRVIASLNQTLSWYREARVAMRAGGTIFAREEEQAALTVLRSAFEAARAQAAVVAVGSGAATAGQHVESSPRAEKIAQVKAEIQTDRKEVARLRQQLRTASRARRAAVMDDLAAATNRLELDRVRLDFLTRLEESDASSTSTVSDLEHQIQTLEESAPELRAANDGWPASPPPSGTTGTRWGLVQRLIEIHHTERSLDALAQSTRALEGNIRKDLQATQVSLRPVVGQLRSLVADPSPGGSLADGQRAFRALLERSKQLRAVVVSLRREAALAHRLVGDLEDWKGSVDRERWQVLQSLGIGLVGVIVALAAVLVGGVLWRVVAVRYVHDAYRRRLLLMARNVVVVTAMALVVVFHFASELTALVTGLGFAAAGIAFALQNVILALAGYFSMVAPNGIRLGDRVSLQGPFGYVQGEVLEIGLVRIRLRELNGEPLRPTGRVVVFPNSVVFTGSFFKHPPSDDSGEGPRSAERSTAARRAA